MALRSPTRIDGNLDPVRTMIAFCQIDRQRELPRQAQPGLLQKTIVL